MTPATRKIIESFLELQDTPNASMSAKDWQRWEDLREAVIRELHLWRLSELARIDDICHVVLKNS